MCFQPFRVLFCPCLTLISCTLARQDFLEGFFFECNPEFIKVTIRHHILSIGASRPNERSNNLLQRASFSSCLFLTLGFFTVQTKLRRALEWLRPKFQQHEHWRS